MHCFKVQGTFREGRTEFFNGVDIDKSIMAAIQKRRTELRHELTQLEKQIYDLETTYLEETKEIGNIFTGWSAYVSPVKEKVKIRKQILNEDRLFSLSSITSPAARAEAKKV